MKFSRVCTVVTACVLISILSVSAYAQDDKPALVKDLLAEANCPLTDDQEKELKGFEFGGGFETFMEISEVFDDKQTDALKEILGVFPGFQGGPERPRMLAWVVLFENEGCPFTYAQIEQIKELPEGREAFEKMRDIYSEEQSELIQEMFRQFNQ